MRIRLKLIGSLRDRLPPGGELEMDGDEVTLSDLLNRLQIAPDSVQVVSVNEQFEYDYRRALAAGDKVTILPRVIGG